MIRGTVNARGEAIIHLRVRGPSGAEQAFNAVVDTGFTGAVMLPTATVVALGLQPESANRVVLATAPRSASSGTRSKFFGTASGERLWSMPLGETC